MIRMKCPTCARTIGIDEAYVGKPALCPGCHGMFIVPVPAVLLDETPAPLAPYITPPPLSSPPLEPLVTVTNPAVDPPASPLLPDGPIPLAPDTASRSHLSAAGSDLAGLGGDWEIGGKVDDWARSEPRLRPLTAEGPPPVPPSPPPPVEQPATMELSPAGAEVRDWQFLTLDAAAATTPQAAVEEPQADVAKPQAAVEGPQKTAEEWLPLPLEPLEEEAHEPLLLEPSGPLVAEPVLNHDGPVHLPVRMEPIPLVPESGPSQIPEGLVTPVGIVPPGVVTPAYDLLPPSMPPPLIGERPAPPRPEAEPTWGVDENNFDPRRNERDPYRPRKKRREYGFVSLIPGVDDFYLSLIVLAVTWLLLGALVMIAPRFCMIPIIVGGTIWVCATFWLNVCVREADPFWKVPFFAPVVLVPFSYIFGKPVLFALGMTIAQLWAAFFAIYFRDRALRAFLVTCLALLISGMGWAAMPRRAPAEDNLDNRPPFVDVGP